MTLGVQLFFKDGSLAERVKASDAEAATFPIASASDPRASASVIQKSTLCLHVLTFFTTIK